MLSQIKYIIILSCLIFIPWKYILESPPRSWRVATKTIRLSPDLGSSVASKKEGRLGEEVPIGWPVPGQGKLREHMHIIQVTLRELTRCPAVMTSTTEVWKLHIVASPLSSTCPHIINALGTPNVSWSYLYPQCLWCNVVLNEWQMNEWMNWVDGWVNEDGDGF